jgi:lysophospholipase L1-like esterase
MTMMLRRLTVVLAVVALTQVAAPGSAMADDETSTHYYVAMGDSLAQGWQPDATIPPYYQPHGYVPQVYAALGAADRKLALDNISCGGEGTDSMINGSQPSNNASSCGPPAFYRYWYRHKTQLAEAVSFLSAHKSKTNVLTIDIGGNDLGFCLFDAADAAACLATVYSTVATNLDTILTRLQSASPETTIVGMTYYNPVACLYFFGDPDTASFVSSQIQRLNAVLVATYSAHGVHVADVAGAFSVGGGLEAEATATRNWTWFCSPEHFGDVHPNDAGYQVIAQSFLNALKSEPRPVRFSRDGTLPGPHPPGARCCLQAGQNAAVRTPACSHAEATRDRRHTLAHPSAVGKPTGSAIPERSGAVSWSNADLLAGFLRVQPQRAASPRAQSATHERRGAGNALNCQHVKDPG